MQKYFQGSEIRILTSDQRRLKSERDISCYQCWIVDIKMFPPKRRLSVQLSRHANFMAFLLLWPNKIPISPRSRMLTFNFNVFLTNICVGRLWNMAIYGNRLYFNTVPFYTHFFRKWTFQSAFIFFCLRVYCWLRMFCQKFLYKKMISFTQQRLSWAALQAFAR